MFDEKFFLAISFFVFFGFLIKLVAPILSKSLDDKSKEIADELLEAKQMKEKATKLLKEAQAYNKESSQYAEKLLKDAKVEADKFLENAQQSIAEELEKKKSAAQIRIKYAEETAIQDIQNSIVTTALENIESEVEAGLEKKQNDYIIDQATSVLEKTA